MTRPQDHASIFQSLKAFVQRLRLGHDARDSPTVLGDNNGFAPLNLADARAEFRLKLANSDAAFPHAAPLEPTFYHM